MWADVVTLSASATAHHISLLMIIAQGIDASIIVISVFGLLVLSMASFRFRFRSRLAKCFMNEFPLYAFCISQVTE